MRFKIALVSSAIMFLITAALFWQPSTAQAGTLAVPTAATVTLQVGPGIQYSPAFQVINVGDSIKWVWDGVFIHSTTSGTCSGFVCTPDGRWDSSIQSAPFEYTHTFTTTGFYTFYCAIHGSSMQGSILVAASQIYLPLVIR